jgi:uncharacterized protein YndB with AHSA1/START domain
MPTIRNDVNINAPVDRVFDVCDHPDALTLFAPGADTVSDVHRSDGRIGDSFRGTYVVMGIRRNHRFTCTEYDPPRRIAVGFEGRIHGITTCTLTPRGRATNLMLETSYKVAGPLLQRALNGLVFERQYRTGAERVLGSIKRGLESIAA